MTAPLLARTRPEARPRALLAIQDAVTVAVVRHRLERDGLDLATVVDGPAALDALADGPFDLVVLDVTLPGVDGLDVLRRVRDGQAGPPALPVMVLAWPSNDALIARAYDLDADIVLVRPLTLAALSAGARRLARLARLSR